MDLAIYTELGLADRAAYAMDALKRSMVWDERRFGREYDLDVFNIVAISDFNMGAMENKGLNVFNHKYVLLAPDTATDGDYAGVETVIAHEYFHNWTGNRITCRDWFQLCLKEGLTVYRDQEFSADERSRTVKRIASVHGLKAQQFPEDQGPLQHPVRPRQYREINNFYTATVYEKGSELVRMLAIILGEEGFRAGMDLYFARHDGDAATIEDFLACFAEATGADLSQFALWYDQAGTPELHVAEHFADGRLTVSLRQNLARGGGRHGHRADAHSGPFWAGRARRRRPCGRTDGGHGRCRGRRDPSHHRRGRGRILRPSRAPAPIDPARLFRAGHAAPRTGLRGPSRPCRLDPKASDAGARSPISWARPCGQPRRLARAARRSIRA